MKNPIKNLYEEICKILSRCPYWRRCPRFNRDKCHEAEVMRACGIYRKYEQDEGARAMRLHEELMRGKKRND